MAKAKAELDETPPTPELNTMTSDLFPPPTTPFEGGPECGLSVSFTNDILLSLTPEEDPLSPHTLDPFFSSSPNVDGQDVISGRSLVSNGDREDVVMETERVHEVAVMEVQRPEVVLEMAQFTSVLSPPTQHLMMAEQVEWLTDSVCVCVCVCVCVWVGG